MIHLLLLDIAEPGATGTGIAGLVFVGLVVLMLTGAVLLGAVFLFKRLRKTSGSRLVVGDVCLNLDKATPASPQISPNQP